jgi:hypothetical protein
LWGDPIAGAAYSRAFKFCDSDGAEIMEPLTFKGRRGSGRGGDRCAYADTELRTRWDWQKYEYTYRVWGRLLYSSETEPDASRRYLRKHFGESALDVETSLANASRILPLITTAHLPSAANNNYWPELYVNHSLIDAAHPGSYSDTPAPKVFGNVSPIDPQLFYRINDYADDLLERNESGKYSPQEVAGWLEDYVEQARQSLTRAIEKQQQPAKSQHAPSPEFRRLASDVLIQMGLGRFFAAKIRSAILYRIFEKTGEQRALRSSLEQYKLARDHWKEFANIASNVYVSDITVGELPQQHGHWIDRLPAIERDIEALEAKMDSVQSVPPNNSVSSIITKVLSRTQRPELSIRHVSAKHFVPGQALKIDLQFEKPITWAKLYYRHVNQAERFNVFTMERNGSRYAATIPADYTNTVYPLQYYFEIKPSTGSPTIYPGLSKSLTQQPYFLLRRA